MIGYESTILLLTTLTLRQIVERDEDRSSLDCLAAADSLVLRIVLCCIAVHSDGA
mgnify:CR=1 FL=1